MKLSSVRPSVLPSHQSTAAAAFGGLLLSAIGPTSRTHQRRRRRPTLTANIVRKTDDDGPTLRLSPPSSTDRRAFSILADPGTGDKRDDMIPLCLPFILSLSSLPSPFDP